MHHLIEFRGAFDLYVAHAPGEQLEKIKVQRGQRVRVDLFPQVIEGPGGPVEAAHMYFEDGSICDRIPYGCFRFVEEEPR